MSSSLSKYEEELFVQARTKNFDPFTEYFFRLPMSGTWYTPEDHADDYSMIYDVWKVSGKPSQTIAAMLGESQVEFRVVYREEYAEPSFLFHHGYFFLEWAKEMLTCGSMVFVGEGGTGAGKTSAVGIAALMMAALYPGFDFLNVAPRATQAADMIDEVTKWVTSSPFGERFVTPSRDGKLFVSNPYPTMIIDAGLGSYSTFGCMTLGQHADTILGKGKDWINVDEASLVPDIGEAIPRLVTRYRGTRRTGMPRFSRPAFSTITNPHINLSFDTLRQAAQEDMKKGGEVYHFIPLRSDDNKYITASQLKTQRSLLDTNEQLRWLEGDRAVIDAQGMIPAITMERCYNEALEDSLRAMDGDETSIYEMREGIGVVRYEFPHRKDNTYLVFGDPGTQNATSIKYNNVPVVGVLDVTEFPKGPASLAALHMVDGNGQYGPWVEAMKYFMSKYRCGACYDATSTQRAFMEYGLDRYPNIYPVSLSGNNKAIARTMFILFAGDALFAWPRLRVLWYQAAAYRESGPGLNKIPDDVISGLFVASFYLRAQFYDMLSEMFNWEELPAGDEHPLGTLERKRMDTVIGRRYTRKGGRWSRRTR